MRSSTTSGRTSGRTALIAAKATGGRARVFAFEPSPSSFRDLARNVEVNECGESVTPLPLALWSETGLLPVAWRSDIRRRCPPPNRPPAGREGRLADDRHPARRRARAARRPGTDPRQDRHRRATRSRCCAAPARRLPTRAGARSSSSSTGRRPTATARSAPCSRGGLRSGELQERTPSAAIPDPGSGSRRLLGLHAAGGLNHSRRHEAGFRELPLQLLDPPAQLVVPLLGELDRVAVAARRSSSCRPRGGWQPRRSSWPGLVW